jgi:hypothetical protein
MQVYLGLALLILALNSQIGSLSAADSSSQFPKATVSDDSKGSGDPDRPVLQPKFHPKFEYPVYRYDQVYDKLVCAVLENDLAKAKKALEDGCNPLQRLAFDYSLRHVAYSEAMDDLLLSAGVAPICRVQVAREVERHCYGFSFKERNLDWERDLRWRDVRGMYPEDYPIVSQGAESGPVPSRKELAQFLRENSYHKPSKS